ncbi:hypothetical protein IP88_04395 [alpha proteobacterium AAP81b]|nr:hypothetical protein IP88_04395 [alpha proteobacterium AAP81b]
MLLAAAVSIGALAVPATAAVNVRQLNQQRNIDAGLRSGKLTRAEYRQLKAEQRAIERNQARYTRDGFYSAREKAMIHAQQDAAGRHIDRLKANGRRG